MTRVGLAAVLATTFIALAALQGPVERVSASASASGSSQTLPTYDSRDLTPRWTLGHHRVGAFHLEDQTGQSVTERDLDGKIHVASFIFTSCASVCPVLVERLKPVQAAIRDKSDVVMVSYSVTPLTDTPEVLAAFGRLRGIDPDRWRLLTGDVSQVKAILHDSYFADDDRATPDAAPSRLLHTEKVLLVDRSRRLRGIYNGTNAFEVERLLEDMETLRREN